MTNHLTQDRVLWVLRRRDPGLRPRLLVEGAVQRRSTSYNVACGSNRKSINGNPQSESLTQFHVLCQFEPGQAVLVHGTLPRPIRTPVDGGWSLTRGG